MSLKPGKMEKSIEDLEREITCAVCHEHYTQPKVLPCLHYYCERCVQNVSQRRGTKNTFSCPECRKDSLLPEGGVEELPAAFFVNRLKSTYYELERAHSKKVETGCEVCGDSGAAPRGYCQQCSVFLCRECMQSHFRLKKIFTGHQIVSLGDMETDEKSRIKESLSPHHYCPVHSKSVVAFCMECNVLICHSCTEQEHKGHKFDSVSVAAPKMKERFINKLSYLEKAMASLSDGIKEVESNIDEFDIHLHSMTSAVKRSFQELHSILDNHEGKLLGEIEEHVKSKKEKLTDQKSNLKAKISSIQVSLQDNKQLTHEPDEKFITTFAEITSRVSLEVEECKKLGEVVEPVEEIDIMVKLNAAEDLEQLCQSKTKIVQLPVNVMMEDVKSEIFSDVSATVDIKTTKLSTNKPNTRSLQLTAELRSLHDGSVTECDIKSASSCHYRINFTPKIRGRNEFIISIQDQQVSGSPIPIFVSVSPLTFKKPVSSWKNMKQPSDVIINSAGEIIIAEFGGDILVFDQSGNKLRSIDGTKHESQKLNGAAVDDDGNIYFVGPVINKIYKYEVDGDTVINKVVERENVSGHRSVEAAGNEVLVSEQSNKSKIAIYDRDLNFLREIAADNLGSFIDITLDISGNIYATCWANTRVQVFTKDGIFSHSFGHEKGSKESLSPRYLCVTEKFIYVTDNSHSDVAVFSREGHYVTSFGRGYFIIPHGVCVDQDGFVYVCDFSSSKVLVF